MKKVLTIVLTVILLFMFSSCSSSSENNISSSSENNIVGKWILDEEFSSKGLRIQKEMEFFSDGKVQAGTTGGNYSIDGDRINIYYAAMDSYTYIFTIDDNVLTLKSDDASSADDTEYKYFREGTENDNYSDSKDEIVYNNPLSAECDYVLAGGISTTGDKFELVANESKNYDGTQSVGLIKNNEWIIEMTANSPIIDETGSIYFFQDFKYWYERYIDPDWNTNEYPSVYKLITDNCFLLNNSILWNFETGSIFIPDYNESIIVAEDVSSENRIIYYSKNETYKILNTSDMTVIKEFEEGHFDDVEPFSEGLFYAEVCDKDLDGDGYNDESAGFYNEKGELEIDLSKYNVTRGSVFSDGKTTFEAENQTGKKFEITIDKSGNVISEVAVD